MKDASSTGSGTKAAGHAAAAGHVVAHGHVVAGGHVRVDGAAGEGGGQILRNALALSLATGRSFTIEGIRAGRASPGLLRQHLACVRAATEIGRAAVEGDVLGSRSVSFAPAGVHAGDYSFAVGSAGSALLVLQAVLLPLLTASGSSRVTLEGGTHNPNAPTFEHFDRALLSVLRRMGARVTVALERRGYLPAGGGRVVAQIEGVAALSPLTLLERGDVLTRRVLAMSACLPDHIVEREAEEVRSRLDVEETDVTLIRESDAPGPGNAVVIEMESAAATEVVSSIGRQGRKAESVARDAASQAKRYLGAGVPIGLHLADQLVVPFALAGGGAFRTLPLSAHTLTAIETARLFLPTRIEVSESGIAATSVRFAMT